MTVIDNKDCYGCGVCSVICPKNAIEIGLNTDGFYAPNISLEKCVDCGLCAKACAYNYKELSTTNSVIKTFAGWSRDKQIRKDCTSGGVAFELARTAINDGNKVCGVKYNGETCRAEHYIATNEAELESAKGSKYIQSYTVDGFKGITKNEKYLVTGTPCQIDSFRRYIRHKRIEDNFILIDIYCHGVMSMFVWRKYLKTLEDNIGKISSVSWRNKVAWKDGFADNNYDEDANSVYIGWHDSYNIIARGEKGKYQMRRSQGNPFYKFFLAEDCLGKACYQHCKYRYDKSAADIRIGDMWGEEYRENKDGVNGIVVFTDKGLELLHKTNCELIEYPLKKVAEGQHHKSPSIKYRDDIIHQGIVDDKTSFDALLTLLEKQRRKHIYREWINHPGRTAKDVIKCILKPIRGK